MKAFILGFPYSASSFTTPNIYRGVQRTTVDCANNSIGIQELFSEYYDNKVEKTKSLKTWLYYANKFKELSNEPFELIISKSTDEVLPSNIDSEFLGYEVVYGEEESMIVYWLRERFGTVEEDIKIYDKYQPLLNKYYLFNAFEDAKKFIADTMFIQDKNSNLFDIDYADGEFEIRQIFKIINLLVSDGDDIFIK